MMELGQAPVLYPTLHCVNIRPNGNAAVRLLSAIVLTKNETGPSTGKSRTEAAGNKKPCIPSKVYRISDGNANTML